MSVKSGVVEPVTLFQLSQKNIHLMRPSLLNYVDVPAEFKEYANALFGLIESKKLNIAIHDVYPLAETAWAHTDI